MRDETIDALWFATQNEPDREMAFGRSVAAHAEERLHALIRALKTHGGDNNGREFGLAVITFNGTQSEWLWAMQSDIDDAIEAALATRAQEPPQPLPELSNPTVESDETEESVAADAYWHIARTIATPSGYSVQEHVETMKEVLQACSDFLHDFNGSDTGGDDEAVRLAADVRNCLAGRIDMVDPRDAAPPAATLARCAHGVLWPHECKACADEPSDEEVRRWMESQRAATRTPEPAAVTSEQKPLDDARLQRLFGDAIEGALAFGFQGSNQPPDGHWLARFWNIGNAERSRTQEPQAETQEDGPWIGCRSCDVSFHCHNGKAACMRLPQAERTVEVHMDREHGGLAFGPHPDSRGQAREGWRWVPVEPTPEMLDKGGMEHAMNFQRVQTSDDAAGHVYRAMLAASPDEQGAHESSYPECSGEPASCPENEGFGCCKTAAQDEQRAQAAQEDGPTEEQRILKRAVESVRLFHQPRDEALVLMGLARHAAAVDAAHTRGNATDDQLRDAWVTLEDAVRTALAGRSA